MKIGLISLGCPKNLVDSEVMLGLAQQSGHELTKDPASAEVLVVNTCAFIDSAKRESVDAILEMAEHKKAGTCRRLIVTGCLAERYRHELRAEIPEIDAVLGTGEVPAIVGAIAGAPGAAAPVTFYAAHADAAAQRPAARLDSPATLPGAGSSSSYRYGIDPDERSSVDLPGAGVLDPDRDARPRYLYDAGTPRTVTTPKHYAYVKVAEGCDYSCTFCIIPTLRGSYRSRTTASIVEEVQALADRGVKEVILISQDTTFYGNDRGERGALAPLLRRLNRISALEWIRLLYLYPTTITEDTLGAMADCEKVCRYIDLPLQHASDPVLRRMGRPGSEAHYVRLLDRIRERLPGVALRTTFIVGFPGETDADVDELCRFVGRQAFDHVGVFTYSHEEGTAAFRHADDVPEAQKAARRHRVMSLQRRLVRRRLRARIGEQVQVLIDGPAPDHALVLRGRLGTQAPDIDGAVYLSDCDPSAYGAGDLIDVEIVGARGYDFVARPV